MMGDLRFEAEHVSRQIKVSNLPPAVARQLDHADAAFENSIKAVGGIVLVEDLGVPLVPDPGRQEVGETFVAAGGLASEG
jgi:hypothetical protein